MIKFALIKERKTPPDRRVVFSPEKLKEVVQKYPEANFTVESSDIRIFSDEDYRRAGFKVSDDVSSCDIMLGVKEVPIDALISNKKYFFFSHTIKQQHYNRDLLREILSKNIELYDHETIVNARGSRLIGFGRYAGIVGTYNGFRMLGIKTDKFDLAKVESLPDFQAVLGQLDNVGIPPIKIVLTGNGKVAKGSKEILDHLGIKEINVKEFLNRNFDEPVYCKIDVLDYNKRIEGGPGTKKDFFQYPEQYQSNFFRFARVSDMFIAGHFYGEGSPELITKDEAKSKEFRIRYVADISCDINGPIASTIRPSTIAKPFYGYDPQTGTEVDFLKEDAIAIMAVDNLPCELPKDASEGFGEMFLNHVMPAFFNNDSDGILERARITKDKELTKRYKYLRDFVDYQGEKLTSRS